MVQTAAQEHISSLSKVYTLYLIHLCLSQPLTIEFKITAHIHM